MSDNGSGDTARQRGLAKMAEVYGTEFQEYPGAHFAVTADHLFADIWSRPGLTVEQRRLLLVGLLAGRGMTDVNEIQLGAAYSRGELDEEALREVVVFLAHYAGWPEAARLNNVVETIIGRGRRPPRPRSLTASSGRPAYDGPGRPRSPRRGRRWPPARRATWRRAPR